jgi:tmRNA-binding protein
MVEAGIVQKGCEAKSRHYRLQHSIVQAGSKSYKKVEAGMVQKGCEAKSSHYRYRITG